MNKRDERSITESQNGHGGNGPLKITQSNPPAEQDHLEHIAQDGIQAGFECVQRRRLHNLSGQPVPVLCHPHCHSMTCMFLMIVERVNWIVSAKEYVSSLGLVKLVMNYLLLC